MGVELLRSSDEYKFESTLRKSVKRYTFNVKFITPLLIGGGDKDKYGKILRDDDGLSGKALRGCWRFWCRAIIGGMIPNIDKKDLYKLESEIFGSAKSENGAKFRLIIEKNKEQEEIDKINLGFRNKYGNWVCSEGFVEGASYSITIIPRATMSNNDNLINILFSTIWLWGNLGSVGKRGRRGFGSPILYHDLSSFQNENGTNIILPLEEEFNSVNKLKNHLRTGLQNVWSAYKQWISTKITVEGDISTCSLVEDDISTLPAPIEARYFILQSCGQIAVGNRGFANLNHAIKAVHGRSGCKELGWAHGNKRMSSPVYIRFHKLKANGIVEFLPIFTWCKQSGVKDRNGNLARDYLTDINSKSRPVFTTYLNGDSL